MARQKVSRSAVTPSSSVAGRRSRTRTNTAVSDRNTTSAVWASRETRYPRIALTPLPGEGVEELVVEDGGVERAVGAPRVAGNHAGRLPPHAAVERLRGVALPRVEHERGAPEFPRSGLRGLHQHAADAAAPGRRHDHELRDLCAVIAVRAPLEVQLHGADDAAIGIARDPEPSAALERQRYAFPVCGCFAGPERWQEAHRRTPLHDILKQRYERGPMGARAVGSELLGAQALRAGHRGRVSAGPRDCRRARRGSPPNPRG